MLPIPAWPDENSSEGQAFFTNASEYYNRWLAKSASSVFALGFLANAEAESSLDPNARGDHVKGEPTAFGLHQRHGPRIVAIKKALGFDIQADAIAGRNTIENEIAATVYEINTFAYYGNQSIAAAKTPYMAAFQVCALFERAGADDAADRRGQMAARWFTYFNPPKVAA